MTRPQPRSTLFPYTTLFRSHVGEFVDERRTAIGDAISEGRAAAEIARAGMLGSPGSESAPQGGELERSEEHTSELQSLRHLVCRLLLEKKKKKTMNFYNCRL